MKTKQYHLVGTVSKSNRKFVERGKIDTPRLELLAAYSNYAKHCKGLYFLKHVNCIGK